MSKKVNIGYILAYVFYNGLTAVIYGFSLYSLMQRGYSSSDAGLLLAFASILSFILQPLLSNISDNSKNITSFDMSIICSFSIFTFSLINYFSNTVSLVLAIAFIFNAGFYMATEPFINSLSSIFERANFKLNFAVIRALGSFAYSIFCFILGKLTLIYSYKSINATMILCSFLLFLSLFFLKFLFKNYKFDNKDESKIESVSYKEFIKNNKKYIILIIFLAFIYYSYICFDDFMLLAVENINGNSSDMGSILSFKAILETIGMMLLFPYLSKRMELENILKISAFFFIIRIILQTIAPNIFIMYLAQIFQAFSFSLMLPGMIEYVNRNISAKELNRGHACITMASTVGGIFASFFAGGIAENYGVKAMEIVATIIVIIGALGIIITLGYEKKHK